MSAYPVTTLFIVVIDLIRRACIIVIQVHTSSTGLSAPDLPSSHGSAHFLSLAAAAMVKIDPSRDPGSGAWAYGDEAAAATAAAAASAAWALTAARAVHILLPDLFVRG
jgi:hypothetical protein